MANDFLTNLRASRGGGQSTNTNKLPTRGDIQKQKQGNVSPDSFVNFLRIALGGQRVPIGKEQISIEEAPASNVDKMSPEVTSEVQEKGTWDRIIADRGSLKYENDLNKYNAAVRGTTDIPYGHSEFENAYGVLNNYNELNKVLDEYDAINTWNGKRQYLKDVYKKFDDKYGDISKWFDRLYGYTLEAQAFNEDDTKKVTDVMRQINENVKNRFLRKV